MSTPAERFQGWIDSLAASWKDRLKDWMASWLGFGIEVFADVLAKSASEKLQPMLDAIEATGGVTPEIKPLIDEMRNPTGEFAAGLVMQASSSIFGKFIDRLLDIATRPMMAALSAFPGSFLFDINTLIAMRKRYGLRDQEPAISDSELELLTRFHGLPWTTTQQILALSMVRFPSDVVGPAWLRDKEKYEKYWDDVKGLGIDEGRLELIKEMVYKIPGVGDIIRHVVKEAYNPELYKKFGQDQEYPGIAEADAEKAGVRPDYLLKEWISHWNLPSTGQGFEMLHREQITLDEMKMLLKALDVMPFWRDKLEQIAWNTPNRVELRMLARYGLVDKKFLIRALKFAGLHEEYRDILADLMLAQGMMTDIGSRYRKGWIDGAGVKAEIAAAGLSAATQDRLYKWIVANEKPERLVAEKDLLASEIISGYKKGILPWEDTVSSLTELGYDEYEAQFKIAIAATTTSAAVDPETTVNIDTARRQRRSGLITHDQEVQWLLNLGVAISLASAYANNDDLRITAAGKAALEATEEA